MVVEEEGEWEEEWEEEGAAAPRRERSAAPPRHGVSASSSARAPAAGDGGGAGAGAGAEDEDAGGDGEGNMPGEDGDGVSTAVSAASAAALRKYEILVQALNAQGVRKYGSTLPQCHKQHLGCAGTVNVTGSQTRGAMATALWTYVGDVDEPKVCVCVCVCACACACACVCVCVCVRMPPRRHSLACLPSLPHSTSCFKGRASTRRLPMAPPQAPCSTP